MTMIETERLLLREWTEEDAEKLAEINKDPRVMEYVIPATERLSVELVDKMKNHFIRYGFGLFACTVKETGEMIGWVGLNVPDFKAPFTPCVEIGWRLAHHAWGKGYATEATLAVLDAAFNRYGLEEVVAYTVPENLRCRYLMEKIGMAQDLKGTFRHPKVPLNHPLQLNVLYRLQRDKFSKDDPLTVLE